MSTEPPGPPPAPHPPPTHGLPGPPPPPFPSVGGPSSPPPYRPPEPDGVGRVAWLIGAAALAILFVVILAVVLFLAGPLRPPGSASPPVATGQGSPPPPSASPATPDPNATPTPPLAGQTLPPDIAAQIDQVVGQVPALRELQPLRQVPYRILTREQLATELEQMLADEIDRDQLAAEERLLKRLGLLPDDSDLYQLLVDLYTTSIAAYYRPDTGAFYVVERTEPFGAFDRVVVAHEYTHALQDQHFDLEGTRITDPAEGDAALAQLAAVEGDATHLMFLWAIDHLSFEELFEILSSQFTRTDPDVLAGMPAILRRQLAFPYTEGYLFAQQIHADGGWAAINETLRSPPASTEQIMHPETYLAGERPVAVELADDTATLGAGWQPVYAQTFGELNVGMWATGGEEPPPALPGMPAEWPFAEVGAGWGGDRLHMYEDGSSGWAIVWETAWDSPADAAEFETRANELLATLDGPARLVSDGLTAVLLVAHDQATLERLAGAR